MATNKDENLLSQGVDVWNRRRRESPGMRFDLSNSYLAKKNLINADFRQTNLSRVDLTDADLRHALPDRIDTWHNVRACLPGV